MGFLDPQGPSRGSRSDLGARGGVGSVATNSQAATRLLRQCLGPWAGCLLMSGVFLVLGCRNPPPPEAAGSNEVFSSRHDHGLDRQGLIDDRWASIVLDESQRAAVREILQEAAAGPVQPLVPARYGIRFEDAPFAMVIAARKVEMAILETSHEPATSSVTYLDSRGRQAIGSVQLRKRGPIARVEYRVPGDDAARERAKQLIDLEDRLGVAVDLALKKAGPTMSATSAEAILRASVRSNRGRVLSSQVEPEHYRFSLLMLDGQRASLTVRREPGPRVLSVQGEAGLFMDADRVESLELAFRDSLEAWGRTLRPEAPRAESGEIGPRGTTGHRKSIGEE